MLFYFFESTHLKHAHRMWLSQVCSRLISMWELNWVRFHFLLCLNCQIHMFMLKTHVTKTQLGMSVKEMACLYEICVLTDSRVIQYLLLCTLLKWPKQLNQNRKSLAALDWITFIALMSYLNSAFNCCSVQINMTDCVRLTKGGVSVSVNSRGRGL